MMMAATVIAVAACSEDDSLTAMRVETGVDDLLSTELELE